MTTLLLTCMFSIAQTTSASALFEERRANQVGILYWLQDEQLDVRLTESDARVGRRYHVYFRSNVGGFLVVFLTVDGSELTARTFPPYTGLSLRPGDEFRLPGTFELAQPGSTHGLVFLFARSQTEMVRTAGQALDKLDQLRSNLVLENAARGPEIGTYVVNRAGHQPAAIIGVTR